MEQPAKKEKNISLVEGAFYTAPLPDARQFEYYERVEKGAANRILQMAEQQAGHRQKMERWSIGGDQVRSCSGLLFGFLIALVGLGGAIFLLFHDKHWTGSIVGVSTLGSLVGTFIYGSMQKGRGRE